MSLFRRRCINEGTMEVRDSTIKQGEIIAAIKKHKTYSLEVLERRWFILSWDGQGGENHMKFINDMICLLNLERARLTFLSNLVTVNDGIFLMFYSHPHSVSVNLRLWLNFHFSSIFQTPPLSRRYSYLLINKFFNILATKFSSFPF